MHFVLAWCEYHSRDGVTQREEEIKRKGAIRVVGGDEDGDGGGDCAP